MPGASYWYGWLTTFGPIAATGSAPASLLPEAVTRRLWSGWAWVVPIGVMIAFCYILGGPFVK